MGAGANLSRFYANSKRFAQIYGVFTCLMGTNIFFALKCMSFFMSGPRPPCTMHQNKLDTGVVLAKVVSMTRGY